MMHINVHTKIAVLLKESSKVMDALIQLSPRFEKLRNPLLRKLLAGRTNIVEAARLGGCTMEQMAEKLEALGFVFEKEEKRNSEEVLSKTGIPDFVRLRTPGQENVLDVRTDLREGQDPLKKIIQAVKQLPEGHVLRIINVFEPVPLINLLSKKGFTSYVRYVSTEEVHTYLMREKQGSNPANPFSDEIPEMADEVTYLERLAAFGTKIVPVDVRAMEMPMPMITILESLSSLPTDHVLSVQHKQIPIFLFHELRERKFNWLLHKARSADIRLLIFR